MLKSQLLSVLKNLRIVRIPYRAITTRREVRRLAASVQDRPSMPLEEFRRVQPPLLADLTVSGDATVVDHESMRNYMRVTPHGPGRFHLSDSSTRLPYHTRQRMLATVYQSIPAAERTSMALMDLGGSVGYYGFLASPWQFAHIDVLDARAEHAAQFSILQRELGNDGARVRFIQQDFLDDFPRDRYDIVLAQGILYHTYDHFAFIKRLIEMTRRYLVLETELSGYGGMLCLAKFEAVGNSRMGTKGPALYPSYGSVLGLLRSCGVQRVTRILPPRDRPDLHGYRRNRRVMLLCET